VFIALAFFSWGVWGPTLHQGQHDLGAFLEPSGLRAFLCVGIAYFAIAVVVPLVLLFTRGEKGRWTIGGVVWSVAAGAAGAVGALGIILAFKSRGSPVYVMPLVFGLAPVVNTFVTMFMNRSLKEAGPIFYMGVAIVAIGAAGVLTFQPKAKDVEVIETDDGAITVHLTEVGAEGGKKTTTWQAASLEELAADAKAYKLYEKEMSAPTFWQMTLFIPLSILLTAVCWGSYGPVLHKGQSGMKGSRLRPFLCVGLAYFVVAVVAPLMLMPVLVEAGGWNVSGTLWSLASGSAGALGALGIIMAFNFGGKPIYVMPLVFGCAPVVNTFVTVTAEGTYRQVQSPFFISLGLVILGAVTVLVFAPRGKGHGPKAEKAPKASTVESGARDKSDADDKASSRFIDRYDNDGDDGPNDDANDDVATEKDG
jgi:MFS family permease